MLWVDHVRSPLGTLTIVASDDALCALAFPATRSRMLARIRARFPGVVLGRQRDPNGTRHECTRISLKILTRSTASPSTAVALPSRSRSGRAADDSARYNDDLPKARRDRTAPARGSHGWSSERAKPRLLGYSVPPDHRERWSPHGVRGRHLAEAVAAGARGSAVSVREEARWCTRLLTSGSAPRPACLSADASRVRKRPEHVRGPCHSPADSVRFEQEDAACADESVFP